MSGAALSPFTRVERLSPGERRAPRTVALAGMLVAAASLLAWWLVDPQTPDLAAQVYRSHLYDQVGFTVWDNNWYAGHHVPGYSLLFPPLAHLLGLRLLAVIVVLSSTALFAALMRAVYPAVSRWAIAFFALAASADVWIGRLTFALGVTLGLAAVLLASREHRLLAGAVGALCSAASPVAGLFVALAAVADAAGSRRPLRAVSLGGPPLAVVAALSLLFPEGGRQPFAATSLAATLAAALAFLVLVPARERALRIGAALYALAVVASRLVSTPMGSNAARLAVLFAGPLLVATHAPLRNRTGRRVTVRRVALALAVPALVVWTAWGPVREAAKVAHDPSVNAAYYAPVRAFLADRLPAPARVEVPFTRAHWEAVMLGERFALARGWERQLDTRYDALFFEPPLTAARYRAWLQANAVRFVALPDVALDVSSRQEGQLLRRGLSDLRLVFQSAHWRVFAVTDASPLVQGAGTLTALSHDGFSVQARAAGRLLVRIHYTRYWQLVRGAGCVTPAAGGLMALTLARPETVEVRARFSLGAAVGAGHHCA